MRTRTTVAARLLLITALNGVWTQIAIAAPSDDPLQQGFESPPDSARPRIWWHWMNGNITQEGIKLDLEWMRRIGLGGTQVFDAAYNTPTIVDQRLVFMTPPWKQAFRSAVSLASELGLEMTIAGSPGWSESGGPWVKPERGMKKLVWTETRISGGAQVVMKLPHPPTTVGPFQDVAAVRGLSTSAGPEPVGGVPDLYRDVAVIAYPLTAEDQTMSELHPTVTSSGGEIDTRLLWDGRFSRGIHLPYGKKGEAAWLQVDFGRRQMVQSMILGLQQSESVTLEPRHFGAELQWSSDGSTFHRVVTAYDTADDSPQGLPPIQQTITFAPVTARYFRLLLPTPPVLKLSASVESLLPPAPTEHLVTEFVLSPTPRVDHVEQKAAYFLDTGTKEYFTRHVADGGVINQSKVVDLTARLQADGTLRWMPPAGRWEILRIGYSLLGITNHPASPEGTGLEVDKLSRTAVKAHMDEYLSRYASILGSELMGAHGLRAMVNDSYEAGPQNWTDELPTEFARRRGYDLREWLPALTGRIIGNAEATDKFLWDFRRTLGELIAESHYGQISASLHSHGMLHYGEAHETGRAFVGDGMDAKRDDDIPMAAMWMPDSVLSTQEQGDADIRESASVAHIYGQTRVAAESMTAFGIPGQAFGFAPETLKPTADRELADGLNLFVIHTSAHQPLTDKPPGITLGPFGQWFTRNETWAEEATPWITYLSRSSYLLQQGHFVADVVYYYGQDSNITALYGQHLPPIPDGYAFDFASAHALTKLTARDGYLVSTGGVRYRALVLGPRATQMSLDVLKTIAELVRQGGILVGNKPEATPSRSDDPATFRQLTDALWGNGSEGEHTYGAGRIVPGRSVADALKSLRVEADFGYSRTRPDTTIWYVHRQLTDGDLYFVSNRKDRSEHIEAQFRVSGKAPELWHADTGVIEPASYREAGGRTIVPLNLDPYDAVFVVFRKPAKRRDDKIPSSIREPLSTLIGPWEVHFQARRGAPERTAFATLNSWTASADTGIKFFSGTATYTNTLNVPPAWLQKGRSLELDLGSVKNVARVNVNGKLAGVLWKAPFRVSVTALLHPGNNTLTVDVTNLWVNRLIGDKQPNSSPVAMTTLNPYTADSPLMPSGLLGPVRVMQVRQRRE